ncbi:2TM domain-containing protein [Photobacterium leiognathi]|uniref:2TM domain-containing protein n=1 Tax=Photobacterium leiognathi TaxID=553611 RepID=UPI0027365884|nr:2TM domain-containing protein [Photobacterium leiognathi]
MIIRKLRLQRGWSQEQLSQLSGLSIRTIQRIEQGQKAGLESLKSLAAVFEIQVSDLQMEPPMNKEITITEDEKQAIEYVKSIKEFYSHLVTYLLVITGLFVINYFTSPDYWWAVWPALGWGIGIVSHALSAFEVVNVFGPDWERKQVEKRLGRKL